MRCAGVAFSAALATVRGRGTPCFSSVILSLPFAQQRGHTCLSLNGKIGLITAWKLLFAGLLLAHQASQEDCM